MLRRDLGSVAFGNGENVAPRTRARPWLSKFRTCRRTRHLRNQQRLVFRQCPRATCFLSSLPPLPRITPRPVGNNSRWNWEHVDVPSTLARVYLLCECRPHRVHNVAPRGTSARTAHTRNGTATEGREVGRRRRRDQGKRCDVLASL